MPPGGLTTEKDAMEFIDLRSQYRRLKPQIVPSAVAGLGSVVHGPAQWGGGVRGECERGWMDFCPFAEVCASEPTRMPAEMRQ